MSDGFEYTPSRTYCVYTGCGNIFITVCSVEGQIVRVITHRKSVCECDLTFFDALNRQTSFQTNRELEQAISDLRGNDLPKDGHFCRKYNASVKGKIKQGILGGYSCADAVAKVIEKEIHT
jgi:hypothetical protein